MASSDDIEEMTRRGEWLAQKCYPLLAGHGPEVQAAAIADLFGTFLSCFPDSIRAGMIERHGQVALDIARIYDRDRGTPHDAREKH